MPPASLSTLAVMKPGPNTERNSRKRSRQRFSHRLGRYGRVVAILERFPAKTVSHANAKFKMQKQRVSQNNGEDSIWEHGFRFFSMYLCASMVRLPRR